MATHYADREEFFDGNIVVFRRGDAVSQGDRRYFQARFKLDGRIGFKTISLKTRNRIDAIAKAKSLYLSFSQAVKDGSSIENRTFNQAWRDWYQRMVAHNVWSDSRKKWHLNYFNRYFQAYFGDKKLDEITSDFANEYFVWRKRYWVDGDGSKSIEYNRRRKGLKTHSSHNVKKDVSFTTLRMEKSALNQFFSFAYETKRWIRYPIKLKLVASQRQKLEGQRSVFDNAEWNVLTRNLLSWVEEKGKYAGGRVNSFHRHQRQQLRFFILFIGSTGIRPGTETRFMKWSDITSSKDNDGIEKLKIRISADTKMGRSRTVISQPHAVEWMKEWRAISHYPSDQDYVWYGQSKIGDPQVPATDLNKTFQSFLRSVEYKGREGGLLFDADGGKRSLYSIRHFYATQRVLSGVTYEDLRRNMGTGIPQLIKHYDHVITEQRSAEITKTNFKDK
jgi:integrase